MSFKEPSNLYFYHMIKTLFYRFLVPLLFLICALDSIAQLAEPHFRSPLDIPLYLSGNFGELRSDHFHTGIDIKTQGTEGKAVYAVDSGYVSRIKISTGGYGKAIYINHPNGYTSVYAHLQKASPEIETYIQKKQYARETFTIELFPSKDELVVSKGELIARSGNTGSSGGPHLHFEIRDTKTEEPLNPLLYGFNITDHIKPIIKGLRFYPLSDSTYISPYSPGKSAFEVSGSNGRYTLAESLPIKVYGTFGLAVNTYDLLNGYPNKCGIYRIELRLDSALIFIQEFNRLNFSTNRYINAYTDYALFKSDRSYFHKQFIGKNNKLKIYPYNYQNGRIEIKDDRKHLLSINVFDSYENATHLEIELEGLKNLPLDMDRPKESGKTRFTVAGPNFFMDPEITIDIPPMALYDAMNFSYSKRAPLPLLNDSIYQIGDEGVALQKPITIRFHRLTQSPELEKKTIFVSIDDRDRIRSLGRSNEPGALVLKTRSFGRFSIAVDTVAPIIKPINISAKKDLSTYNTFSLQITDNLSGIETYRGTIDGEWILMEYEPKQDRLTYRFDNERVNPGPHTFRLEVSDAVNNKRFYEVDFTR